MSRRLDVMLLVALLGVVALAVAMAVPHIWPEIAAFQRGNPPAVAGRRPPAPRARPAGEKVCEIRTEKH